MTEQQTSLNPSCRKTENEKMEQVEIKLYDAKPEDAEYRRSGCRGIIIRDGKILLAHFTKDNMYLIPGGGMEVNESLASCCMREVEEETGLIVVPCEMVAKVTLYYKKWEFPSFYFVCRIEGQGKKNYTENETKRGMTTEWISLEKAREIFGSYDKYKNVDDERYGTYIREYSALSTLKLTEAL